MLHVFVIRAPGNDLDGEPMEIQDASLERARDCAAFRVRDIFSLTTAERRASVRAEYVATYPSRRAYEKAEESGVELTTAPRRRAVGS